METGLIIFAMIVILLAFHASIMRRLVMSVTRIWDTPGTITPAIVHALMAHSSTIMIPIAQTATNFANSAKSTQPTALSVSLLETIKHISSTMSATRIAQLNTTNKPITIHSTSAYLVISVAMNVQEPPHLANTAIWAISFMNRPVGPHAQILTTSLTIQLASACYVMITV